MSSKKNPLKLNKLQLRTLALLQVLASQDGLSAPVPKTGDVMIIQLPQPQGDRVQIGPFTVLARDASGLFNPAAWTALIRKGLARTDSPPTLTAEGMIYDTGHSDKFVAPSDY